MVNRADAERVERRELPLAEPHGVTVQTTRHTDDAVGGAVEEELGVGDGGLGGETEVEAGEEGADVLNVVWEIELVGALEGGD